jgi:hypothetical protein
MDCWGGVVLLPERSPVVLGDRAAEACAVPSECRLPEVATTPLHNSAGDFRSASHGEN